VRAIIPKLLMLFLIVAALAALAALSGCVSCIPQYMAPPTGPVSQCYPQGHDPYIPMDHNPTPFNPWDMLSSLGAPFLYGPPR
jgi:hypothetical protein